MNKQALALYHYALEFAYENVGKEDSDKPHFQAIVAGKFAELIVRECGIVGDNWVNDEDNGKNLVSDRLKQHFGVES